MVDLYFLDGRVARDPYVRGAQRFSVKGYCPGRLASYRPLRLGNDLLGDYDGDQTLFSEQQQGAGGSIC